jgi:hypothetical protein
MDRDRQPGEAEQRPVFAAPSRTASASRSAIWSTSSYLRGYEDYAITTDRAGVASLTWRYPLIIDRGVAATLWWLPSSFVSQVDLELFATGAIDRRRDLHAAAGGALTLHATLLRFPVQLGYQVARRVRDDDALTHLVELGISL